jgi:hypothetical protein
VDGNWLKEPAGIVTGVKPMASPGEFLAVFQCIWTTYPLYLFLGMREKMDEKWSSRRNVLWDRK